MFADALAQIPRLDPDQTAVIEAPAASRLLVTAGPGTGKTSTLLARAEWLVDREGLEPGAGLLVLSFSRAAVETVSRRGFAETDLGRLPVRTIDSLSSLILMEAGLLSDRSTYDGRVEAATEALAGADAARLFAATRHVLVDEAQDIVGIRALFVQRLLEVVCKDQDAGFTVFGDPAQAIFDFHAGADPERLLDQLGEASTGVEAAELKTNHRMRSQRLVDLASSAGSSLRNAGPGADWLRMHDRIAKDVLLEPGWTQLAEAVPKIRAATRASGDPRVAVLCRTNAEVLSLAVYLQREGLDVGVRHRAQDRGGAPWLAMLFAPAPGLSAPIPLEPDCSSPDSWMQPPAELARILRQLGLARSRDADLGRLAGLLRCGACPEELTVRRDPAVTVSNIHRAKGLEYDTVFVVRNGRACEENEAPEEARVMFVAGTRAREELLSAAPPDVGGLPRGAEGGRAIVCSWNKRSRPVRFEVRVSDSDQDWAPATVEEFRRVQTFIADSIAPGDAVELRLRAGEDGEPPFYDIVHLDPFDAQSVVGRTASEFGKELQREVWGRPPTRIIDLIAEVPDSASMNTAAARVAGIGDHGLHLRARVYGLGRLCWN